MTEVAIAATPVRARTEWLLPTIVAVAVASVVRWATAPYVVGVFHDDGIYALLARSIASGQGFHYSHLPGLPAATHYPPLYPLALSLLWRMAPSFPANLPILLGANALFVGLSALGVWRFATTRLGWRSDRTILAVLAATLATPVLALAGALLSETLFLALLWPALIASERTVESTDRAAVMWTGIFLGMLMLVRTHALALVVALVIVLSTRRRWVDAGLVCLAAALVQLPWQLWTAFASPHVAAPLAGAYGSYVGWFVAGMREGGLPMALETVRANSADLMLLVRDRLMLGAGPVVEGVVIALALVALCAGAWSFARRAPVSITFLVVYLAIVLVWPYTPWRFVWAVCPLVTLLAFEGVRTLATSAGRWRTVVAVGAALPALAFLRTELHSYASRSWRTPARQAAAQIEPVVEWVRAQVPSDEIVLSEGEQVVALYAARKAAPPVSFTAREYLRPPAEREGAQRLRDMLVAVPARYVILLSPVMVRSAETMVAGRPALRRIEALSSGAVYEVVR